MSHLSPSLEERVAALEDILVVAEADLCDDCGREDDICGCQGACGISDATDARAEPIVSDAITEEIEDALFAAINGLNAIVERGTAPDVIGASRALMTFYHAQADRRLWNRS